MSHEEDIVSAFINQLFLLQQSGKLPRRLYKPKNMTAPADDAATADTVVEGVTDLMMGMINPFCYSD